MAFDHVKKQGSAFLMKRYLWKINVPFMNRCDTDIKMEKTKTPTEAGV